MRVRCYLCRVCGFLSRGWGYGKAFGSLDRGIRLADLGLNVGL